MPGPFHISSNRHLIADSVGCRFCATPLPANTSKTVACRMSYMHVCTKYNMERPKSNAPKKACPALYAGLIAVTVLLAWSSAMAQSSGQALSSLPSTEQVLNRNQDPFAGSIPQGTTTTETIELTIEDALQRGLKYNLG